MARLVWARMVSYPEEAWGTVPPRLVAVFACIADMPSAAVAPASCNEEAWLRHLEACLLEGLESARGLRLLESPLLIRHRPHSRCLAQARAH